jgi:lysophospholipase L1-like esterase
MPRREAGPLTRALFALSAAVRDIERQREPHARFWDDWNAQAARDDGPLWVALGDSTSQGIGADDPLDGWVPRMVARLREHTGEPWRVINLSITGAQLSDIAEIQVPRMHELDDAGHTPRLVTHLAGANDLLAPHTWPRAADTARHVMRSLPADSVVARVGTSSRVNGFMARMLTGIIEDHAQHRPFHLFWPWAWPSRDGLAADRWHPGPKGYGYMVDLIWEPVSRALGISPEPD